MLLRRKERLLDSKRAGGFKFIGRGVLRLTAIGSLAIRAKFILRRTPAPINIFTPHIPLLYIFEFIYSFFSGAGEPKSATARPFLVAMVNRLLQVTRMRLGSTTTRSPKGDQPPTPANTRDVPQLLASSLPLPPSQATPPPLRRLESTSKAKPPMQITSFEAHCEDVCSYLTLICLFPTTILMIS